MYKKNVHVVVLITKSGTRKVKFTSSGFLEDATIAFTMELKLEM